MTLRAKILIDECISRPAIEVLRPYLDLNSDLSEVAHQLDIYGEGADDSVWVPQAAKDGWSVVTADRGKHSPVEAKLPVLCEAYGVTHILISAGLAKRRMQFRVLKIEQHWNEIVAAAISPDKGRYSLRLVGESASSLKLLKLFSDSRPKRQQNLIE